MNRVIFAALVFVLSGCAALSPAATPTVVPTASPVIVIQTVIVTVIPTEKPTEAPTATPAASLTPQVIVVTATPLAASTAAIITSEAASPSAANLPALNLAAASSPAASVPAAAATATLPANAGGNIFTNLTRSTDHFSLRCLPGSVGLGISTANPYVVEVDLFYRIEDRLSVSISDWKNAGRLQTDKNGNFTLDFSAAGVNPDLRSHKAWFDYEFVGINKLGDVVGRSAIIARQITYTIDCSD